MTLKYGDRILEELKRAYSKVIDNFPEAKGVDLKFNSEAFHGCSSAIDIDRFVCEGNVILKPEISVGYEFYSKFNEREREATVAHELGHIKRKIGYSQERLARVVWLIVRVNRCHYATKYFTCPEMMSSLSCNQKRLLKWSLLEEIYADNEAAKSGYGKEQLNTIRYFLKRYSASVTVSHRQELEARISNLEMLLESQEGKKDEASK